MEIILDQLTIQPLQGADRAFYIALNTCPEVMKYHSKPLTAVQAEKYFEMSLHQMAEPNRRYWCFVISCRQTGQSLGLVYLVKQTLSDSEASFGIVLSAGSQGKNIGFRVTAAIIDYGQQSLKLQNILLSHHINNAAMAKIAAKLGFKPTKSESGFKHLELS